MRLQVEASTTTADNLRRSRRRQDRLRRSLQEFRVRRRRLRGTSGRTLRGSRGADVSSASRESVFNTYRTAGGLASLFAARRRVGAHQFDQCARHHVDV